LPSPCPTSPTPAGWILTEVGRQPWIVFGLMRTEEAFRRRSAVGACFLSLVILTLVYGGLMLADVYLLPKLPGQGSQSKSGSEPEVALAF
jgi:cytochrome bd ubiquinol oxidase subunit I